jgi:hypothetical protein
MRAEKQVRFKTQLYDSIVAFQQDAADFFDSIGHLRGRTRSPLDGSLSSDNFRVGWMPVTVHSLRPPNHGRQWSAQVDAAFARNKLKGLLGRRTVPGLARVPFRQGAL